MCRRDSFITHRAFCDALAVESAKEPVAPPSVEEEPDPQTVDPSPPSPPVQSPPSVPTSSAAVSLVLPDQTPGDLSGTCNFSDCILLICWYNSIIDLLGLSLVSDQQILFLCF